MLVCPGGASPFACYICRTILSCCAQHCTHQTGELRCCQTERVGLEWATHKIALEWGSCSGTSGSVSGLSYQYVMLFHLLCRSDVTHDTASSAAAAFCCRHTAGTSPCSVAQLDDLLGCSHADCPAAADVTKYLEFKGVDGSYVMSKQRVEKVPATDMEALKSPLMGLFEKNRARQFFRWGWDA